MTYIPDSSRPFDDVASTYDDARRRLIPPYDRFYASAVDALALGRPLGRVLDLGAGTGLLSRYVLEAHPTAELTLLDGAAAMLAQARSAFGNRASYVTGDLAGALPDGPWDAVISSLAIHHLDDDGKRQLFSRVHGGLAPGGVFVNAEQVAAPTPALDAADLAWHRTEAMRRGSDATEWSAALARMEHDRCATVEAQLLWLREAGFADVDCAFKDRRFAVLVARTAGVPTPHPTASPDRS